MTGKMGEVDECMYVLTAGMVPGTRPELLRGAKLAAPLCTVTPWLAANLAAAAAAEAASVLGDVLMMGGFLPCTQMHMKC